MAQTHPTHKSMFLAVELDLELQKQLAQTLYLRLPKSQIRRQAQRDFHITLGFKRKDIHNVQKGLNTLIYKSLTDGICKNILKKFEKKVGVKDEIRIRKMVDILNTISDLVQGGELQLLLEIRYKLYYKLKKYEFALEDCHTYLDKIERDLNIEIRVCFLYAQSKNYYQALYNYKKLLNDVPTAGNEIQKAQNVQIVKGMKICYKQMVKNINPRDRQLIKLPDGDVVKLSRNFSWVIADQLAGISVPKNENEFKAFEFMNIGLIVTVMKEHNLERKFIEKYNLENIHYNVRNYYPPDTLEEMIEMIDKMEDCINNQRSVLVHCGGGKGRAGTVLACFVLKHGLERETILNKNGYPVMSASKAINVIRKMRPGSIETERQEKFISEYCGYLWKMI